MTLVKGLVDAVFYRYTHKVVFMSNTTWEGEPNKVSVVQIAVIENNCPHIRPRDLSCAPHERTGRPGFPKFHVGAGWACPINTK